MIPYTLTYIFDPDKGKGSPMRIRVRWANGARRMVTSISTRHNITLRSWSQDAQRCKVHTTHGLKKTAASIINKELNESEERIEAVFRAFFERHEIPTPEEFKKLYKRLNGEEVEEEEEEEELLHDVFYRYIVEVSHERDWSLALIGRFKCLRDCMREVDPKLTFKTFNNAYMVRLLVYFRDTLKLRNITISKKFSQVRSFAKWANQNNLLRDLSVLTYSPSLKNPPKAIVYLTWAELMRVYHYEFTEAQNALERVRDLFCFCCFSSLRFSDAVNLKRSDIYPDSIEITTLKTADRLRIDLNDYSRAILDKYAAEELPLGRALPSISNQRTNDYLKSIGVLCGLDTPITMVYFNGNNREERTFRKYELLTTHCGRRTFICNALALGVSPTIVMKWTGHSDYKAMKPYIDIADDIKAEAMRVFNR